MYEVVLEVLDLGLERDLLLLELRNGRLKTLNLLEMFALATTTSLFERNVRSE